MQNYNDHKQQGFFPSLIGEPTPAKASGLTFTLATIAVVGVSFLFLMALAISGLAAHKETASSDWYLYCSYLLPPLTFALVAWWVLNWTKTPVKEAIKAQKCHPKYFLIAVFLIWLNELAKKKGKLWLCIVTCIGTLCLAFILGLVTF